MPQEGESLLALEGTRVWLPAPKLGHLEPLVPLAPDKLTQGFSEHQVHIHTGHTHKDINKNFLK